MNLEIGDLKIGDVITLKSLDWFNSLDKNSNGYYLASNNRFYNKEEYISCLSDSSKIIIEKIKHNEFTTNCLRHFIPIEFIDKIVGSGDLFRYYSDELLELQKIDNINVMDIQGVLHVINPKYWELIIKNAVEEETNNIDAIDNEIYVVYLNNSQKSESIILGYCHGETIYDVEKINVTLLVNYPSIFSKFSISNKSSIVSTSINPSKRKLLF